MRYDLNTNRRLTGIQALRAAAALAVVAYHAAEMWSTRISPHGAFAWPNGAAGVDVFFVISGFVMAISAGKFCARPGGARRFLRERIRRIVPLYWICSAGKMAAVLIASPWALTTRLSAGYCAASFLFLPVHDGAGRFKPLLAVGWTLSFEMFFYALFAACLARRLSPAMVLPPVLASISLAPRTFWWLGELCNPIVLEFAYGTALAALWTSGWRVPKTLAWILLGLSAALLLLLPQTAFAGRFITWGFPAAALVAATVSLEPAMSRLPRFVPQIGDASYAIYLTHGFVLPALAVCLLHLAPAAHGVPTVLLGLAASAAIGWAVHVAIEKPLLGAFRPGAGQPPRLHVTVLAGGGLSPLSGGVGILVGNLQNVWGQSEAAPCLRIIDTRGSGGLAAAVLTFLAACATFLWLGLSGRTQLVHAHMTTRGSAARKTILCAMAMGMGIPVILHMHGADFFPFFRHLHVSLRVPLRFVLLHARHVLVLGQAWRDFLVREVGVRTDRISIVPNGVPHHSEPFLRTREIPNILFLGRLCARKGVPDLIAALASPDLRSLPWQATIAGDGNAAPYRAMLGWHRLGDRVAVPGWTGRAETARLLAGADMLVLPSYHEAMPLAVLEALAAGVPVIATPVGSLPDILQNEVNALLVPQGDPAMLAAAIMRLLQDDDLRLRLAQAGYQTFRQKLEIGAVADRIAALYRRTLAPAEAAE